MKELRVLVILTAIVLLLNLIFGKISFLPNLLESRKIIPKEQWSQALIGKWKYESERKNFREIYIFEGDVEYFADGTFKRHVTLSLYHNYIEVKKIQEDLAILGGGTYEGRWEIGQGQFWFEETTKCEMRTEYLEVGTPYDKEADICFFCTNKNALLAYGDVETYDVHSHIVTFTNKKIFIKAESLSDKGTRTSKFTKIK